MFLLDAAAPLGAELLLGNGVGLLILLVLAAILAAIAVLVIQFIKKRKQKKADPKEGPTEQNE